MLPCSSPITPPIIGFLCEWVRRASTQLEKWNCLRALCNFSCIICGTSSLYFPSESLKLPPSNKHFLCSGAANTFGVHSLPCCECCLQKWLIKLVVHSCISHTASLSLCKPWPLHKFYSRPGLTKLTLNWQQTVLAETFFLGYSLVRTLSDPFISNPCKNQPQQQILCSPPLLLHLCESVLCCHFWQERFNSLSVCRSSAKTKRKALFGKQTFSIDAFKNCLCGKIPK